MLFSRRMPISLPGRIAHGDPASLHPLAPFALVAWPWFLNDLYLIALRSRENLALLWALDALFYAAIPTTTLCVLLLRGHLSAEAIGLRLRPSHVLDILLSAVVVLPLVILFEGELRPSLESCMGLRLCTGYTFPEGDLIELSLRAYASFSAGILEEIAYRGLLFVSLRRFFNSDLAVVTIGALVFSAAHWCQGPVQLVLTFLWAFIPGIWYVFRRSLAGPIALHVAYDWFAL